MRRDPRTPSAGCALPEAHHEARAAYRQGRIGEALDLLAPLFAADGADPAALRDPALLRAWCLIERKEPDAARAWLAEATLAGHLPSDDITARVIDLNARLYGEEHEAIATEAADLLRACNDPADLDHAELRLILGAARRWQGQLDEALGHVEFACSAFTVLDEPGRCAVAANFLGWTCLSLGRLNESRRWFEKSLGINTRLEAAPRMAQNYQNLAIVCYKQGDYVLAEELLEKELGIVRDQHPDMTCRALIALGNVRRLQGEHQGARTVLLDAFALAGAEGMRREEALALEFLGDVFRDEDRPAEARQYYARGLAVARDLAPRGDLVMELTRRRGECLDTEGRHADAEAVLHEALELCREVGDDFETAVVRRCLGVNAGHLGRWRLARKHLDAALEGLQGLDARHETMIASFEMSRLLVAQADAGAAAGRGAGVLDEAWRHGLRAQQLGQETGTPVLGQRIANHLSELARRRLGGAAVPTDVSFSVHRTRVTRVVAVSAPMQQTLRRCDGVARYDTPVLLAGEAGSGKELLARRIHETSVRGSHPLRRVYCRNADPERLAIELFGRAARDGVEPGLIARAEGGSLLLDGIESLPSEMQTRVLHLVQDGVYLPEGSGRERAADVRLLATTEADLARLADQRRFRQDLYFRLRLMSVDVPALRTRPDDLVPLLDHFFSRLEGSTLAARTVLGVPALEQAGRHHWPGNATELEAFAQQAWLRWKQGRSRDVVREGEGRGAVLAFAEGPASARVDRPHRSGLTSAAMKDLLARSNGNKARVARNLGVSRMTLYRWLRELDGEPA